MGLFSFLKKPKEPESPFRNNMNYMIFEGDGVFLKTGRKRKIRVEAFSEEEAHSDLVAAGYDPASLNISRVPFAPPSEEQISAMRKHKNKIPKNACKIDISFLMAKIIADQNEPDKQMVKFATEHKVKFSYFIGEDSLYEYIWNSFDTTEKAAFYLVCVKNAETGKWEFDSWETYLQKATIVLSDEKFMNSFKRYVKSGFGGFMKESSSRNTNCYKIARETV